MSDSKALPPELKRFVESERWTFAKTMSEWPHEYIVRERVEEALFQALVTHIREHGAEKPFYRRTFIYFSENGWLYWTMGAPIAETTVINRCKAGDSFESRQKNGTLPVPITERTSADS
jgi:hypothetical protein